jgi:hypothetical protein
MNGEKMGTGGIATRDDEVGADVALVAEQMLLEHRHDGDDARFTAGGEGVEFEVRRDEGGGEFRVRCSTRACAPDLRRDVMELLAVLGPK